uniref:Aspartic peptidase A1 n=1 Tax=Phakopsora pachyrhizi TaxID=170000 RepID=A0A0S1MJ94_PHAPC
MYLCRASCEMRISVVPVSTIPALFSMIVFLPAVIVILTPK